jgi:hypothetical protein
MKKEQQNGSPEWLAGRKWLSGHCISLSSFPLQQSTSHIVCVFEIDKPRQ